MESAAVTSLLEYLKQITFLVEKHEIHLEAVEKWIRNHPELGQLPNNLRIDANRVSGELRGNLEQMYRTVLGA